jgi:hypothetical protein
MSTITQGNYLTGTTAADFRLNNYKIVKFTDNKKTVALCGAASDEVAGILDEVPQGAQGGSVSVKHISSNGTGKVRAGAALSFGAYLVADSTGRAVAATQTAAGSQPTKRVFGRALEAATAADDLIEFEHVNFLY